MIDGLDQTFFLENEKNFDVIIEHPKLTNMLHTAETPEKIRTKKNEFKNATYNKLEIENGDMSERCKDYIQKITATNKGHRKVKFSFIAFDAISYQETVRRLLEAKSTEELAEARKFVFCEKTLIMLEKELLWMSTNLGADAENIMIVRDIVDFNYENAKGSMKIK